MAAAYQVAGHDGVIRTAQVAAVPDRPDPVVWQALSTVGPGRLSRSGDYGTPSAWS